MPLSPFENPCTHYYEGYPYDYAVLAGGMRMCGSCYKNLCQQSDTEDAAIMRSSPIVETDYTALAREMRQNPPRRRCLICGLLYEVGEPHYEECQGADAPGIQTYR